jgi:hypothetical protein
MKYYFFSIFLLIYYSCGNKKLRIVHNSYQPITNLRCVDQADSQFIKLAKSEIENAYGTNERALLEDSFAVVRKTDTIMLYNLNKLNSKSNNDDNMILSASFILMYSLITCKLIYFRVHN